MTAAGDADLAARWSERFAALAAEHDLDDPTGRAEFRRAVVDALRAPVSGREVVGLADALGVPGDRMFPRQRLTLAIAETVLGSLRAGS